MRVKLEPGCCIPSSTLPVVNNYVVAYFSCDTGWWRLGTALDAVDMKDEARQAFTCALQLDPR